MNYAVRVISHRNHDPSPSPYLLSLCSGLRCILRLLASVVICNATLSAHLTPNTFRSHNLLKIICFPHIVTICSGVLNYDILILNLVTYHPIPTTAVVLAKRPPDMLPASNHPSFLSKSTLSCTNLVLTYFPRRTSPIRSGER